MAFDREHQLLFVACRTPGTVIALDAATGKEVASQPAADGADDLFYDPALRRVYVISGAGEIDSYQVDGTKNLHPLEVAAYRCWSEDGLVCSSAESALCRRAGSG
jgi:hypothetical protein